MNTLPSITQIAPFAPLSREQRDRLKEMREAATATAPGKFSISSRAAPTAEERAWLEPYRASLHQMLRPGDPSALHDRLHVFLAGFSQLRSLDAEGAAMMLENFVEAVEGLPLEVVARTCRAWNQKKIKGVDYRYPPGPPEFRGAADEIMAALRVERRDVEVVLRALPAPARPPAPTDEEREACAARAAELVKVIADAGAKLDAELSEASTNAARLEQEAFVRRFQAAEAERKARIALIRDGAVSSLSSGADLSP
jgi:hypothetical protein